ncbi:MAG: hypothetical protein ACYDBJ_09785 [Aggregatilineales bacterium]
MKKTFVAVCSTVVALALTALPAFAAKGVFHYGPIASTSPDSGTCGNDWATDTFQRFFTVNSDNPNVVIEEFKAGTFVTFAGSSPGACPTPETNNGSTVAAGITGKMHGSFDIAVTGGTFNPNAVCTASTCDTTRHFIDTVYGTGATYVTGATYFIFHYRTECNGTWQNASANRGGNSGDITGAPTQCGNQQGGD